MAAISTVTTCFTRFFDTGTLSKHVSVCHYVPISVATIDNRFYSIIGAAQDDVDDSVDVCDVDFAITVHVGNNKATITA